ncbi:hypothetical protein AKO1_011333 [Acrasis kona]|uniref:Pseudouridine synthase RsuA/RluA-like domain-containing protein n=1 Tax=Acrasis kona TaxID=1008807 RepID=A0AAW2YXP2_9EUKA
MIKNGSICINNNQCDSNHIITKDDHIKVKGVFHLDSPVLHQDEIEFVHEDEDYLVVNKPSGVPVQPGEPYLQNTLLHMLAHKYNKLNIRPCHRLDKGTTGVCIFAKNRKAAASFHKLQLSKQKLHKYYIAKVKGLIQQDQVFHVDSLVFDNSRERLLDAVTILSLLKYDSFSDTSLLLCSPVSGRFHQIRQHMYSINHPIVNDRPITTCQGYTVPKYPWMCVDDDCSSPDEFIENAFQKHVDMFIDKLEKKEHPFHDHILLHSFRYECIADNKLIWRYQTHSVPTWADGLDLDDLERKMNDIAQHRSACNKVEADLLDSTQVWKPSPHDMYYCISRQCAVSAKELRFQSRWAKSIPYNEIKDGHTCPTCNKLVHAHCKHCDKLISINNPKRNPCITRSGNHPEVYSFKVDPPANDFM